MNWFYLQFKAFTARMEEKAKEAEKSRNIYLVKGCGYQIIRDKDRTSTVKCKRCNGSGVNRDGGYCFSCENNKAIWGNYQTGVF